MLEILPTSLFFCKRRVLEGPVCTDRFRSAFGVYGLAYGQRVPKVLYFWQLLILGDKREYCPSTPLSVRSVPLLCLLRSGLQRKRDR